MQEYYRCYAVISLSAIEENLRSVRAALPKQTSLMAVLKADAYGHGATVVGKHIEKYIDCAGVASVEEGIELRQAGFRVPILVLGYSSPRQYDQMLAEHIMPTIYDPETARRFSEAALRKGVPGSVHIALDTGMTRIGFRVNEASADRIREISLLPNLHIAGIFSHFSCADTDREDYTGKQAEEFDSMLSMLAKRGVNIPMKHLCNSAGIMKYRDRYYDCVRSGIITYGMYPSEEVDPALLKIRPALSWKTHIIHIADAEPGRGVSYGASYMTEKPVTRIATLAVGYADGYPRSLSGKGWVLIHGQRAPILGRVCMDQMMVDVSGIPDVKTEDVAVLIGRDREEEITIEELSKLAGSFNYEMACGIGKRVKRVYLQ